ncbi:MAG: helix-turn-helix transcriptional regulator [Leptospirales bacterium]
MDPSRKELGRFLRSLRERSSPGESGFSGGGRRRTPGLRREELAQLIGISPTWYSWIEQGRPVSVSQGVLERLSEVLRMTDAQRQYLFELSGKTTKNTDPSPGSDPLPPAVVSIVRRETGPAYLLDADWNAILWNKPAEALFSGWLGEKAEKRNLLEYMFLEPEARTLVIEWEDRARRLIADFRADCGRRLENSPFPELLDSLQSRSPEFRSFWQTLDVSWRTAGAKLFRHPTLGILEYEQATFRLIDRRDLKLTILVPKEEVPSVISFPETT